MRLPRFVPFLACALLGAALLGGCKQRPIEDRRPAPSSGMTYDLALILARRAAADTGGVPFTFKPTGSMLPTLDSRSVGVAEELTSTDVLHAGDIVAFDRAGLNVCHRVVEVAADGSAFIAGDNARSDGWVPRSRIRYRVFAIFYSLRTASAPAS